MEEVIIPEDLEITEYGDLIVKSAFKVLKSKHYPDGIKYSFQLIRNGKRVAGYDNAYPEGHHRHFLQLKDKYEFISVGETTKKFYLDVEKFEKLIYGNETEKNENKN
nr:hypothetical protein [Candidatus Woesearchaeota archaeon]